MVHGRPARTQGASTDIVILTVISAEFEAARRVFQIKDDDRRKAPDGTVYFRGVIRSERAQRDYTLVLTCIGGSGNPGAAAATASAIKAYDPRAVLLMGIAAGLRGKVRIGEVVLSDRVVAYEPAALIRSAGVATEHPRPEIERAPHAMIQDVVSYRMEPTRLRKAFARAGGIVPAAAAGREDEFRAYVANTITARQGTIASGEKLLRDPAKLLAVRELHGKTEVGEMEAAGVVEACRRGSVSWLVIRGISDFGDELKDDRFHTFASCAAAAVLHDFVVHGLDLDLNTTSPADTQHRQDDMPVLVDDLRRNRARSRLRWSVVGIGAMCLLSGGVASIANAMPVKGVLGLLGEGIVMIVLALAFDRVPRKETGGVLKFIMACIVILVLGLAYAYKSMATSAPRDRETYELIPASGVRRLDGPPASDPPPASGALASVSSTEPHRAVTLNASGSTLQKPYEEVAIDAFTKANAGVKINYGGGGSGKGRQDLADQVVDFAGADSPYKDPDLAKNKGGDVLYFPVLLGAITISYNLEGVDQLHLSPATVAKIFQRDIKKWNDKDVAADNPGAKLPDANIIVAHRSDGSNTTDNFTRYLDKTAKEVWKLKTGSTVEWPADTQAGNGNPGVAMIVKSTKGAVGYVDLSDAKATGLAFASIKNQAGKFVEPSANSTSAAGDGVEVKDDLLFSALDPKGDAAYPITYQSWVIVYARQADHAKGTAVKSYLKYLVTDGQLQLTALDFAPLPKRLADRAVAQLDRIQVP